MQERDVLIVGITVLGGDRCVGALDIDTGEPLRLLKKCSPRQYFPPKTFQLGEIWRVVVVCCPNITMPHTEDVVVEESCKLRMVDDLAGEVEKRLTPTKGSLDAAFAGGHLGETGNSSAYFEENYLPSNSTCFWETDTDLILVGASTNKPRYRVGTANLPYKGEAQPVARIAAGSLVRLSLARLWRPNDAEPTFPLRCYVQLSGWLRLK